MNRGLVISWTLFIWTGLPVTVLAQVPAALEQQQSPGVEASKTEPPVGRNHKVLPAWLKLGVELRGRAESNNSFDSVSSDQIYLNRLRLDAAIHPAPWVRFFLQGQDTRVLSPGSGEDHESLRNTFDLRQAYIDFGHAEEGWQLRAGRQEIAVGDERLVGADSYWDCFGQAFDAIRLGFAGVKFHVDAFTGFRVQPARRRLDPFDTASRISGLSVRFKTPAEGVLEPYFLWKRGSDTLDRSEHPGHRDVLTPGVRAQGILPRSLDYNVEMALQRGHVVDDRISAWAGHWELGWNRSVRSSSCASLLNTITRLATRTPRTGGMAPSTTSTPPVSTSTEWRTRSRGATSGIRPSVLKYRSPGVGRPTGATGSSGWRASRTGFTREATRALYGIRRRPQPTWAPICWSRPDTPARPLAVFCRLRIRFPWRLSSSVRIPDGAKHGLPAVQLYLLKVVVQSERTYQ